MSRPLIALSAQRYPVGRLYKLEPAFAIISDYVDAVWRAGGMPMPVLPSGDPTEAAADVLDAAAGVILIGGLDVDPERYGQERHETVLPAPADQEDFEVALIEGALGRGTPLLAICRGTQLLNVALDGTLHQHITGRDGLGAHGVPNGGGGSTNEYQLDAGSLAASVMGGTTVSGRCHHHQAVDTVAPGLVVTGRTADGTVEVMELSDPTSWMLAVQWHPEETAAVDPQNQALFDALVAEAGRARL
ncbi:MAG: gamma-glutamyl-gamma-aminobutyrate hydrolase family protein [Acidimicrobiales bacterium]